MTNLTALSPLAGFSPRIGLYVAQMDDVRRRTKAYVDGLTSEQLAWYPQPNVESIGTLLVHIAAVERSWIGEDIERRPMDEEWKIGFPIRFGIAQISGKPLSYFLEQLDAVRFTIEWILYHLIEHEAHHKGQIALMKRLLPK